MGGMKRKLLRHGRETMLPIVRSAINSREKRWNYAFTYAATGLEVESIYDQYVND